MILASGGILHEEFLKRMQISRVTGLYPGQGVSS